MKNKPWLRRYVLASAAFIVLAAPPGASAATDMFLKIDNIKGESADSEHKDEIDVLAWSWGMARGAGADMRGGAASASRPCISELSFVKYLDLATPLLMANVMSGMTIPKARLVLRKSGEGKGFDYFIIEMTGIVISSVQDSGSSEQPSESVSLRFSGAKVMYRQQKSDGSLGSASETTIRTATGC